MQIINYRPKPLDFATHMYTLVTYVAKEAFAVVYDFVISDLNIFKMLIYKTSTENIPRCIFYT